ESGLRRSRLGRSAKPQAANPRRRGTSVLFSLFAAGFWSYDFNIRTGIALVLASLCCGAVGSLVVGSRMAFFSDALADCAFAGLVVVTFVALAFLYNHLLLDNFNTSLALSRRVPVHLSRYLFIVLLAVIVNLCLRFVGALLINALLIVPAATAINVTRNLRQLFWLTIGLSLVLPRLGQWLTWEIGARYPGIDLGIPGTVVLVAVTLFLLSLLV